MAYTTATHTRAISQIWLTHILDLFGIDALNIKLGLIGENTLTLDDFIVTSIDEFVDMKCPHETDDTKVRTLDRAAKRLLRNVHTWLIWVQTTFPRTNFFMLNMGDCDTYLMLRN